MFDKAYMCVWCKKNLKEKEIPSMAKPYYPTEDTHFTEAIELINLGWECNECGVRWTYEGEIIRDGIPELKDKYEVEKITKESNNESEDSPNE